MAFTKQRAAGPRPVGDQPRKRADKPVGNPPGEARLREAAVRHLSRYATTQAGLERVLGNKLRRWARAAEAEGREVAEAMAAGLAAAKAVAAAMVSAGTVNDADFAAVRARRLARGGRSRRAMAAHLASKGIAAGDARAAMDDAPAEADAAIAQCRKRRIGPFARGPCDPALRLKWLGMMARAGFSRGVAEAALDAEPEHAEARLIALRG